jgi:hypothetical protein
MRIEIAIEELIDRYYHNPDDYFIVDDHDPDGPPAEGLGQNREAKNNEKEGGLTDYLEHGEIASESQAKSE